MPTTDLQVIDCKAVSGKVKAIVRVGDRSSIYALDQTGTMSRYQVDANTLQLLPVPDSKLPPSGSVSDLSSEGGITIAHLKSGEAIAISSDRELAAKIKEQSGKHSLLGVTKYTAEPGKEPVRSSYALWIE